MFATIFLKFLYGYIVSILSGCVNPLVKLTQFAYQLYKSLCVATSWTISFLLLMYFFTKLTLWACFGGTAQVSFWHQFVSFISSYYIQINSTSVTVSIISFFQINTFRIYIYIYIYICIYIYIITYTETVCAMAI